MAKTDKRLPPFLRSRHRSRAELHGLKARLRKAGLHTVCESARCPNIAECFKRPTATFMIMGDVCSRGCRFCAVKTGPPGALDSGEPRKVAEAALELGLKYVVVTSVTRDDLADGGAEHFAKTVAAIRELLPGSRIEVLVPDFQGDARALDTVIEAAPDVLNHNLETVPRLYKAARPGADYGRSLELLARSAASRRDRAGGPIVKSGIMVGLGETPAEVLSVMDDLKSAGAGVMTIGQYLQPNRRLLLAAEYVEPARYEDYKREGEARGLTVFAGPLVRSSYMADMVFEKA